MRRRMLIFVATMMVTVSALAQKLNVRGTVIDENKEAVIGASVLIKGSNIGTKTDIYGQFLLDGVKSGSELVISYVGMKTKTVQARSSLSIGKRRPNTRRGDGRGFWGTEEIIIHRFSRCC